jgi:low affinity Fe/Cu permease
VRTIHLSIHLERNPRALPADDASIEPAAAIPEIKSEQSAFRLGDKMAIVKKFGEFSNLIARASGRPVAFAAAILLTTIWLIMGPIFDFSTSWQLIANTTTSVITFLMVFVIQTSQNRDTAAIQAKLDELIRATEGHPALVGIEEHTQDEIAQIKEERSQT